MLYRGAGWKEECHRVHKVGCCGTCDEWMDGGERRRGVVWVEKSKGGAHGSNMQPLCHGNAVKFVIASKVMQ